MATSNPLARNVLIFVRRYPRKYEKQQLFLCCLALNSSA
jgi:hypothetical protein